MASPVVHVYAVCYNEELLLPYFLRHYETFAERIVVFDGASTDRSAEILKRHPKVVLEDGSGEFPTHAEGRYNEPVLMRIRNEAYKRSRGKADWVMIVDIDEIVYHPDLLGRLAALRSERATLLQAIGYEMVAFTPPKGSGQIHSEIRTGFLNHRYNKKVVFDPAIDIKYHFGCHDCDPEGVVVEPAESGLKLLHYRFLGPEMFSRKYLVRQDRFHTESMEKKWGTHLCLPGAIGPRPITNATEPQLKRMFWDILSEQEILEVVA